MASGRAFPLLRMIVLAAGMAQALFWSLTIGFMRNGLLPFDLVFLWLTVPALALGVLDDSLPLAAGLALAGFIINVGLLALFAGTA
ncbi:MAG: hypothetical protein ACR652_26805 [Methylocystis sp.]|uniref:hypothetical protein n=1 Tax=Methylocystis sp. TaxID=1911079 RepID=UPI003DA5BE34